MVMSSAGVQPYRPGYQASSHAQVFRTTGSPNQTVEAFIRAGFKNVEARGLIVTGVK